MSVLHVITGLNVGGAETMLAKLVEHGTRDPLLQPHVLSLLSPGAMQGRIRSRGVPINTLAMRQGAPAPRDLVRLVAAARRVRPALVQGWMHHGNIAATIAAAGLPGRAPVVWNIRHSLVDIAFEKPLSRAVLRLGRLLSGTPAAIIYNSEVAARQYRDFGFRSDRALVIPNGFDCDQFRPRAEAPAALRAVFGIRNDAIIVAVVARHHPMKDHATLVEAVRRARVQGHDLHLLVVGAGFDAPPPELAARLAEALPADRLTLSPERADVADWLGGADIVVLPSAWGEGFPNILGEAMASGVPCIATDVGDCRSIVGSCGRIVPVRNPGAMAAALGWLSGLGSEGRARLGTAARERIVGNYALARIAALYDGLYTSVLRDRGPPPPLATSLPKATSA
ncbi:glycosyltransferase [Sandarakinorhabdus sp. DWP1-3-1]|uniref:glycosyltransferase n=1 Tax=Sandarakinorhabdus sp. DWP1-3-1 TaxID=2804627 RepID=UPI003CF8EA56